jgi:DNA replication protein DnaC
MVALHGQPGVGKSTLAYAYGHKLIDLKSFSVRWVCAGSAEKLEINYVEKLAKELYKTSFNDVLSKTKPEIINSINKKLIKAKSLLLIFDDIKFDDMDLFVSIYENLPLNVKCLITTNEARPELLKLFKHSISVAPFKRGEAELMLLNTIGDRITDKTNNLELILNTIGDGKEYWHKYLVIILVINSI